MSVGSTLSAGRQVAGVVADSHVGSLRVEWFHRRRRAFVEHNRTDSGTSWWWRSSGRCFLSPLLWCLVIQGGWLVLLVHLDRVILLSRPNPLQDAPARPVMIWR
jgi:hypothetical protein